MIGATFRRHSRAWAQPSQQEQIRKQRNPFTVTNLSRTPPRQHMKILLYVMEGNLFGAHAPTFHICTSCVLHVRRRAISRL